MVYMYICIYVYLRARAARLLAPMPFRTPLPRLETIAAANAAFAPSDDAVAHARDIIAAFGAAREAGEALVVLDGRLVEGSCTWRIWRLLVVVKGGHSLRDTPSLNQVEELHVREAKRLVALAGAISSAR